MNKHILDKSIMNEKIKNLTGSITFSDKSLSEISFTRRELEEGGMYALNSDETIRVMIDEKGNARICSIDGAPIYAPQDSSALFNEYAASKIDVQYLDTSLVENMSAMFQSTQAEEIIFPRKFDTSNVKAMQRMFANSKVKSLDLSCFSDTSNLKNMQAMFSQVNVDKIVFPQNIDVESVTDMSRMFRRVKTNYLHLAGFYTINVQDMRSMFEGCNIDCIDLLSFDTSAARDMSYMFAFSTIGIADLTMFDFSLLKRNSYQSKTFMQSAKIKELVCNSENEEFIQELYKKYGKGRRDK